jgi:hypothetical protein
VYVGAGTGIVSLVLATLRSGNPAAAKSTSSHHWTRILSTDLRESPSFHPSPTKSCATHQTALLHKASSMDLMSYNIRSNAALYPHYPPTTLPLDWDDDEFPEAIYDGVRDHGGFDVVV